jgi:lipid-A-disaccharide synthase-like uncharacterized protein
VALDYFDFMDTTTDALLTWGHFWTVIGWLGNAVFFSRFVVQWYATEKRGQVTVPVLFWWLSLAGSLLLLSYAIFYDKHHVIVFAYAFNWIPYIRNLIIHQRHLAAERQCPACAQINHPQANYCQKCGAKLPPAA